MQSWPEYLDDAVMKQLQFQRTLRLGQLESWITYAIDYIWGLGKISRQHAVILVHQISEVSREQPPTRSSEGCFVDNPAVSIPKHLILLTKLLWSNNSLHRYRAWLRDIDNREWLISDVSCIWGQNGRSTKIARLGLLMLVFLLVGYSDHDWSQFGQQRKPNLLFRPGVSLETLMREKAGT
jgi:hypothetical protein